MHTGLFKIVLKAKLKAASDKKCLWITTQELFQAREIN